MASGLVGAFALTLLCALFSFVPLEIFKNAADFLLSAVGLDSEPVIIFILCCTCPQIGMWMSTVLYK
jgi:hypothetical protein